MKFQKYISKNKSGAVKSMIEWKIKGVSGYSESILNGIYKLTEILKIEVDLELVYNDRVIYRDEYFPFFEFYMQFCEWKREKNSFLYSSMETDNNPILTFRFIDEQHVGFQVNAAFTGVKTETILDLCYSDLQKAVEEAKQKILCYVSQNAPD